MKFLRVKTLILVSAICLLSLLLAACAGTPKSVASIGPATGTWAGTGIDDRGVTWEFTFVLRQDGAKITGTSDWVGSDGAAATTNIEGTIAADTRAFTLKDIAIGNVSGDVAAGIYSGSFSADFQKLTGGWTIPGGGSPGKFEAKKTK
jgi:hypothetical protein